MVPALHRRSFHLTFVYLCLVSIFLCAPVFVHLLKIKARSTVWGSFESGRAEEPPASISERWMCVFRVWCVAGLSPVYRSDLNVCRHLNFKTLMVFESSLFLLLHLSRKRKKRSFDLPSDTFSSVLLCPFLPSRPNTLVGIPHGDVYIRCNTDTSFISTPLSQTLPYK